MKYRCFLVLYILILFNMCFCQNRAQANIGLAENTIRGSDVIIPFYLRRNDEISRQGWALHYIFHNSEDATEAYYEIYKTTNNLYARIYVVGVIIFSDRFLYEKLRREILDQYGSSSLYMTVGDVTDYFSISEVLGFIEDGYFSDVLQDKEIDYAKCKLYTLSDFVFVDAFLESIGTPENTR